jgi:hypothetical protein
MSERFIDLCHFSPTGFAWWVRGDGNKVPYCTCASVDAPAESPEFPEDETREDGRQHNGMPEVRR